MPNDQPDLGGARILLVDDQPANLNLLRALLEAEGYRVLLAPSGAIALESASRAVPDLILLDVVMPDLDGFEVCRRLKLAKETRAIPVVFITARDQEQDLLQGFEVGGVDYITKPLREQEVLTRVRTHLRLHRLTAQLADKNQALEREIARRRQLSGHLSHIAHREAEHWGLEAFVGDSPTMGKIFRNIRLLQDHDTSVLILGESGTGKELVARAIHYGGPRREGPFIPVNCAALPAELAESLLLGHIKGAFTGAQREQPGYFELAAGGTLFLDEIGAMPLALQAKLLRVLEDGQVWRLGARQGVAVDTRVLAATNSELPPNSFRQDLYFRLARFTVQVPPLRQRRGDIALLAGHFLRLFAAEMGRPVSELSVAALEQLEGYDFPGNVRELKNIVERAVLECGTGSIESHHLHFHTPTTTSAAPTSPPVNDSLPQDLDLAAAKAELQVLRQVLQQTDGNMSEAARLLKTNRNRLYRILQQGD